jgi:galactonate dehydratase
MYRGSYWTGGPVINSAISAIEAAMWDITGKYYDAPVYNLLGGRYRDKIKCYTGVGGVTPEELADNVQRALKDGYTACKTMAFGENPSGRMIDSIEEAEQRCKAVRDRVGDKMDIMLGCHGRCSLEEALGLVQKLAKYDVRWIEEPLYAENIDALSELRKKSKIPIATGERLYTKWGFRELFEKQALAIAIQIDTCIPNFLIQEGGRIRGKWLVKEPFEVEKGYIKLPTKSGLGIELDLDAIAERPYKPSPPRPGRGYGYMSYREDGSLNPR